MSENNNLPEEWLSAFHDGELTDEQRQEVESLLESSASTREALGELTQLSQWMTSLPIEKVANFSPSTANGSTANRSEDRSFKESVLARIQNDAPEITQSEITQSRETQPVTQAGKPHSKQEMLWITGILASAALVCFVVIITPFSLQNNSEEAFPEIAMNKVTPSDGIPTSNTPTSNTPSDALPESTIIDEAMLNGEETTIKGMVAANGDVADKKHLADKEGVSEDYTTGIPNEFANISTVMNTTGKWELEPPRVPLQPQPYASSFDNNANKPDADQDITKKADDAPASVALASNHIAASQLLREFETEEANQVVALVVTVDKLEKAQEKIQDLLAFNAIPRLAADSGLVRSAPMKKGRAKKKTASTTMKSRTVASSPAPEGGVSDSVSDSVPASVPFAPQHNASRSQKDQLKEAVSTPSNATAQNDVGLYFEASPIQILHLLSPLEHSEHIQKLKVNHSYNITVDQIANKGVSVEELSASAQKAQAPSEESAPLEKSATLKAATQESKAGKKIEKSSDKQNLPVPSSANHFAFQTTVAIPKNRSLKNRSNRELLSFSQQESQSLNQRARKVEKKLQNEQFLKEQGQNRIQNDFRQQKKRSQPMVRVLIILQERSPASPAKKTNRK